MHLDELLTDDAVVAEIGARVVAQRIARAMTQDEFADAAGVGRSTVQRIESGRSIQLTSFVKLMRLVDRLDDLDVALAVPAPSPLAELERARGARRRVRHGGTRGERDAPQWTWGDTDAS